MLTGTHRPFRRCLALLVALIVAALTIAADSADARFGAAEAVGAATATISSEMPWSDRAIVALAEPTCRSSGSGDAAEGPCQPDKQAGGSESAIGGPVAHCHAWDRAAALSGCGVGLLDRPPNRPLF